MNRRIQSTSVAGVVLLALNWSIGWCAPPETHNVSKSLDEILNHPWRLTSGDDSSAIAFQFEFAITERTADGNARTRRIVVERNGLDCGLLLLAEDGLVWGRLLDRLFVVVDTKDRTKLRLLTDGRFRFVAGICSTGVLGYEFESSGARNLTTHVEFDLTRLVRYLISRSPEISQPDDRTILLRSKLGTLVTLRLAMAERRHIFPLERLIIETPDGTGMRFSQFYVGRPAPLPVLTMGGDHHLHLPVECHRISANPKVDVVDAVWKQIQDDQSTTRNAAVLLTRRLKRTVLDDTLESQKPR